MFRGTSLKKTLGAAALACALIMPASGFAQDVAPAPLIIGVFNADRILSQSAQGQQALAQLDQLQNLRVTELQAQQAQLNALQQRALTAPPDSAAVFQREYQDRQIQLQRLQEDVQAELQARQQQLTEPIIAQIGNIIETLGAAEGFSMIFNALQSGWVYVDERIDLTERIIAELDALTPGTPGGS